MEQDQIDRVRALAAHLENGVESALAASVADEADDPEIAADWRAWLTQRRAEAADLRALLAAVERGDAVRDALVKVRAHTGYPPWADRELLAGLLATIERITDNALLRTPAESGGVPGAVENSEGGE